ncbi:MULTISPECIES: hypothetical protein [Spirulina sp. CCY15215]|uniref:hypothetical protein n=1 Tax=Spirulina sp. CCY15215 TaxID=2767591 RepID=UPI0019501FBA|nr:hypothetical protein [Spirulina major]
MTTEQLKNRIQNAVNDLRLSANALDSPSSISLPTICQNRIREFQNIADRLDQIPPIIDAREYARQILQNLRDSSSSDITSDLVEFQGMQLPFSVARLLGFQSYLPITWSICDLVTKEIGKFVCISSDTWKTNKPAKLWEHFVRDNKASAFQSHFFLKESYGFPIGISYAIRNHFVHDAALYDGNSLFESESISNGFQISNTGKKYLQDKMQQYKINQNQIRGVNLSHNWYDEHEDLLELLELCHRELDDALGCLIGWSVGTAKLQVKFLLERDI